MCTTFLLCRTRRDYTEERDAAQCPLSLNPIYESPPMHHQHNIYRKWLRWYYRIFVISFREAKPISHFEPIFVCFWTRLCGSRSLRSLRVANWEPSQAIHRRRHNVCKNYYNRSHIVYYTLFSHFSSGWSHSFSVKVYMFLNPLVLFCWPSYDIATTKGLGLVCFSI